MNKYRLVCCGVLITQILFLSSCSSAVEKNMNNSIINEINSKYYSLDGKYDEIKFIFKSEFLNNLIAKAPAERAAYLKNIIFYAQLKKGGRLFIGIGNVPNNLKPGEKVNLDRIIAAMKQQINGVFISIAPVVGGVLNKANYAIESIEQNDANIIISDKLKNSNLQDKLYFDNKKSLEKVESYMAGKLISTMIPNLETRGEYLYITGITVDASYPEKQTNNIKITYAKYKGIDLPYKIEHSSEFREQSFDSIYTLEPIEMN